MNKGKKIYVTGTRDRLFLVKNYYDETEWVLADRRNNVYESSNSADNIIKHIENFVEQGKYALK